MSSTLQTSIAATLYRNSNPTVLSSVNRLALAEAANANALQNGGSSSTISSIGQLLSNLANFQSALLNYQAPQFTPNTVAISSDTSIVTASASNSATGSYALNIAPLAKQQVATTADYADTSNTIIGSGTLVIQAGNYNADNNSFTASGSATSITLGSGTLKNLASAINGANAGVSASIGTGSNGYNLQLIANNSGAANAFRITGDFTALNVDPTSTDNGSVTLNAQAGDAAYSVNGSAATYTSNTAVPIATNISANFNQTGSATVSTVPDLSSIQAATQNLVDAYNTLQTAVAKEDQHSTSLLHNMLAKQLPSDMALLVSSSYSTGQYTEASLSKLGISANPTSNNAQSLSLDPSTLAGYYTANPTGTATLLTSATQAFTELGNQYTDTINTGGDGLGLTALLAKTNPLLKATANNYLNSTTNTPNSTFMPWATTSTSSTGSTISKASPQDLQTYANSALQYGDIGLQAAVIKSLAKTNPTTTTTSSISVFA